MKIEFQGSYDNKITEQNGIMLNTISVKLKSGKILTLDRDETNFTLNDGVAYIMFRNTYAWDSNNSISNYNLNPKDFDNATLIDYEIEDDAPDDYDLTIAPQKISAW